MIRRSPVVLLVGVPLLSCVCIVRRITKLQILIRLKSESRLVPSLNDKAFIVVD